MTRTEFFSTYKNAAIAATQGTGIFPETMLTQAALESGNGNSGLTKQANNFFGIKVSSAWGMKPYVEMPTWEVINGKNVKVNARFRKYATAKEGFADYVNFLKVNQRYAKAGVFKAKTPVEQFKALQAAGYATDPDYASKLIGIYQYFVSHPLVPVVVFPLGVLLVVYLYLN